MKALIVCNERKSRGIEFRMAGAEQRNEREPKLVGAFIVGWRSVGGCAGQRSEENGQVGGSG